MSHTIATAILLRRYDQIKTVTTLERLKRIFKQLDYGLLIALVIPIIGILPTFGEGLANGADAPFHAHRIFAMTELIQSGNLYPRWVSYFHMGYGYPVFNFYAPGATHIGAWFHLLGFDVTVSYNLVNAMMWSIGSAGIYLLGRTFLPIKAALLACVLWVYAPSRLFEFWWQGSLAQIVAVSFIPFVFYGIIRTARHPILRNSLWIAIPFAGIVLSHTPTTYMSALFIAPFCVLAPLHVRNPNQIFRRWIFIASALVISAGLSAIFLIPVLAEVQFVRIAGDLPDTVPYLISKFLTVKELFVFPQLIDTTDVTLIMPRTLGIVGGIMSLIGIVGLSRRRRAVAVLLLVVGLGFSIFLTVGPSLNIWLAIPGFQNLRFPERFLRISAMFVALLGGSSILLLPRRWTNIGFTFLTSVVILQALPLIHPRDDDLVWENLSAVDEILMEHANNNWGTTAYDEYEPYWGEVTPYDLPPDLETYATDPFQIRVKESDAIRESDVFSVETLAGNHITINNRKTFPIRFRQFYFPGWEMTVNGEPFPFHPDERFGLIEADLPDGELNVRLNYIGTDVQRFAAIITVVSIVLCLLIFWRTPQLPYQSTSDEPLSQRFLLISCGGFFIFAIISTLWVNGSIFRVNSSPREPYHMKTAINAIFDDSIELLGYTLDSDVVSRNNPLGIRLYWHVDESIDAKYRPLIQIVNLNLSNSWGVSEPTDFEGGKVAELTPDRFMSDYHRVPLFTDVPSYVARISVQLVNRRGGDFAKLPDGNNRILLPVIIRIDNPGTKYQGKDLNIKFGNSLHLLCTEIIETEERYEIIAWWNVNQTPDEAYRVFVHGLDYEGNIAQQNDSVPLDGIYPTTYWRSSQVIKDIYTLPKDSQIVSIALGLYNPDDGTRVPVTYNKMQTDRFEIPARENSCQQ